MSLPEGHLGARRRWLLPACLAVLYLAQCVWFLGTQSLTYDEPVHIAEGLDTWRHGRFEQYNDHPPLARLLCTLPLLSGNWQVDVQPLRNGFRITRVSPDPISLAWRARTVNVLLGLLLAALVGWVAAQAFSRNAANLALALFVFSPPSIAHFSLVTTDGAATLLIFATAVTVARWREKPSFPRTVLLGGVLGLLLLAKFSTLLMFAAALGWTLLPGAGKTRGTSWLRSLWKAPVTLAIALLMVWAGYFFHTSRLVSGNGELTVSYPNRDTVTYKPVHTPIPVNLSVPAGEYLEGLRNVVRHNRRGQPAFFLGHVSRIGGWKSYFPVVALLKWPTVVLVLFLLSMWLALRGLIEAPGWFWVLASFPVLYFAASLFARFDLGDRHILPVYPFVVVFASGIWEVARKRRALMLSLGLMILLHVADGLRYAPDYLSYFNILVRPAESYHLLSDSNLDWGQGLLALREYQNAHAGQEFWLAYFGSVEPAVYGIRFKPLVEGDRTQGIIIVSASHFSGQYLENPASYRWVLQYPLVTVLNHSLFVFHVPRQLSGYDQTPTRPPGPACLPEDQLGSMGPHAPCLAGDRLDLAPGLMGIRASIHGQEQTNARYFFMASLLGVCAAACITFSGLEEYNGAGYK